jgi:hypothetical protein
MTQKERSRALKENKRFFSSIEFTKVELIIILMGDDPELDIDWDDLSETTGLDPEDISELLDTMLDLDILDVLDYEEGIYG